MNSDDLYRANELFQKLYRACDLMRGKISRTDYRAYLFPFIFYKRISDVYDEEWESAYEIISDTEYADDPNCHRFDIPKGCHWKDIRELSVDVGQNFHECMIKIEEANPTTLSGIFTNLDTVAWSDKNIVSDELMINLIEHFSSISLRNSDYNADIIGQAYEYLIKTFADITKKKAGEYYTPRQVVRLMIRVVAPKPGDTIYDPACGTGGMLLESMRYMNDYQMSLDSLYGQEKQVSTASMCKINLFLHGADDFHMALGDTLRSPAFHSGSELQKFDVVVANPPFSQKKWGSKDWEHDPYGRNIYGTPSDNNADFAWVQHMICSMDDVNGRMAVVVPDGVVFKQEYKQIREKMVKDNILWCVLKMGDGLFYGAGVNPYILFFRKGKQDDKVRFINASEIYQKNRGQNVLEDEHVDRIYDLISSDFDEQGTSITVGFEDIQAQGFDLSVNKYVKREFIDNTRLYSEVLADVRNSISRTRALEMEITEMFKGGDFDE